MIRSPGQSPTGKEGPVHGGGRAAFGPPHRSIPKPEYGKARTTTPLDREAIRAHLLQRMGEEDLPYLSYVAYHLMRWILDEEDLTSLESAIVFCGDPDNLENWLPDEVDRVVLSLELVELLRTFSRDQTADPEIHALAF